MIFVWSAIELMMLAISEIPEIFSLKTFIPSTVTSFACWISSIFDIFSFKISKPSLISFVLRFATIETSLIFSEIFFARVSESSIAVKSSFIPDDCSREVTAVSFEITESSLLAPTTSILIFVLSFKIFCSKLKISAIR